MSRRGKIGEKRGTGATSCVNSEKKNGLSNTDKRGERLQKKTQTTTTQKRNRPPWRRVGLWEKETR